jgi:phosphatidylglycerophosphatase A
VSGRLACALATVGGLGDRLPAPGTTVGSLAGLGLFVGAVRLVEAPPAVVALAGLLVLVPLAVWACGAEADRRGDRDPGPVVLDEVTGQWLALSVLAVAGTRLAPGPSAVAFVLFRLFDIVKPWPVCRLERLPGGIGIVADDLAAGLAAGLVQLIASSALGW